jgi:TPR repeat protein
LNEVRAVQTGQSPCIPEESPWTLDIVSLRRVAGSGNVEAQLVLAKRYHHGDGLVRDLGNARDWYKKASALKSAEATYEYAQMSHDGPDTYDETIHLINSAAEQGFVRAQVYLVLMDFFNPPASSGLTKAQAELAVAKGETDALLSLAVLYWTGRDVEPDMERGARLIEEAVDRGSVRAELFRDFAMYIACTDPADTGGISLLERAVDLGNDIAALWLARDYALGVGVPTDHVISHGWLVRAAELGNTQAVFTLALDDYIFQGCRSDPKKEEQLSKLAEELEYPPLHFPLLVA